MNKLKIYLILTCFLILSCSPIQGYYGEELPEHEIATVYLKACRENIEVIRSTSEGFEFGRSGIRLKPGVRNFDISSNLFGNPYNCVPKEEFDRTGYRACLRRRERAIKNEDSNIPICSRRRYINRFYLCDQNYTQHVCFLSHEVLRGVEYDICTENITSDQLKIKLIHRNSNSLLAEDECMETTTHTKKIRRNYL